MALMWLHTWHLCRGDIGFSPRCFTGKRNINLTKKANLLFPSCVFHAFLKIMKIIAKKERNYYIATERFRKHFLCTRT